MNRSLTVTALAMLCIVCALGCAQDRNNLLTPQLGGAHPANGSLSQTHLWGYYEICIDPETQTATAVCDRSASTAFNIVTFLNGAPGSLVTAVKGVYPGSGFIDIDLDVSIKHPFPNQPNYKGYDVRGIFMGDGSAAMLYNSDLKYANTWTTDQIMYDYGLTPSDPYPGAVGMPDGYTRWWNPTEFPNSGLAGYTPGSGIPPLFKPTATLNPYKYFADGLTPDQNLWTFLTTSGTNGVFSSWSTITRNYYLRFPSTMGFKFGYAVVANWISPTTHPANAPEAIGMKVDVTPGVYYVSESVNGGDLVMDVSVFDWDSSPVGGVMTDYTLIVESTVLSTPYTATTADMTPVSSGPNYQTYHLEIPADNVVNPTGNKFWVIAECADENYVCPFGVDNLAGTDKLAACFRYDLPLSSCKFPPLDTAITTLAQIIDAHSTVMDDVTIEFRSQVTQATMDEDLNAIIDNAAFVNFGPPIAIYRIDLWTIPDAAILEQYKNQGKSFLSGYVSECDSLCYVTWVPNPASGDNPFTTIAVVSPDGAVKYEPVLDTDIGNTPGVPHLPPKEEIEGWDRDLWYNRVGVLKATVEINIQALGSDGCQCSFTGGFISSAGWPWVVEPSSGNPTAIKWCFPKYECMCEVKPGIWGWMDCATVTQSYTVILRVGIDPVSADVISKSDTISAWACADGQCGAGTGQ
jgi:hypothetical protein